MTTEYLQPSLNLPVIGRVELNTIQKKEFRDGEEVKVRYSWVRGSCPLCQNYLFYAFHASNSNQGPKRNVLKIEHFLLPSYLENGLCIPVIKVPLCSRIHPWVDLFQVLKVATIYMETGDGYLDFSRVILQLQSFKISRMPLILNVLRNHGPSR